MAKFMLGNVRHSLDDKNRGRIPAKYREGIGAQPYIIPGRSGCLYIIPESKFETVINQVGGENFFGVDPELSDVSTAILGNGYVLEEDGQGRVAINKTLKDAAGIKKDVVFVGKGTFLEVWAAETWDRKFNVLNPDNLNSLLEKLKKYGV